LIQEVHINESFPKEYMLCSKKVLEQLHAKGFSFHKFPFTVKMAFLEEKCPLPFQVVLSIPKRRIPKAHDRNKIKRRSKEALRKNKCPLESFLQEHQLHLCFMVIFSTHKMLEFSEIEKQMIKTLTQVIDTIKQHENQIPTL
jgi:ribonuclease P protein component